MKRPLIVILSVLLLALMFVACNTDGVSKEKYETVSVSLNTGNETSSKDLASAYPAFDKDNYYWRYTATKTAGAMIGVTTTETKVKASGKGLGMLNGEFATGKWTFSLYAYSDAGFTKKVYAGSVNVTFTGVNAVETITVSVGPLSEGSGTLIIGKLNPKSGVPTTTTQIAYVAGGSVNTSYTDATTVTDLASGTYTVTIELSYIDGTETFKTASEPIQVTIYDNLTTTISGNVEELTSHIDLGTERPYTVTFDTKGGSSVASQIVINGEKILAPTDVSKTGFALGGWYETTDSDLWDFTTDAVTTDTTLNAKWLPGFTYLAPTYNTPTDAKSGIKSWYQGSIPQVNCTNVTSGQTSWGTANSVSWYVVNGSVTNDNRITCQGNVNLILLDDGNLNATKGITVTGDNSLTIYAQSTTDTDTVKMGILTATGTDNNAGIGGCEQVDSKNITINGGRISARGGSSGCSGIGGGHYSSGENIVINNGIVTAYGGGGGAGIGGGNAGSQYPTNGMNITINGGSVTANGGAADKYAGAGIGGGHTGKGCYITINGGSITANGGAVNKVAGAGIGGGDHNTGENITINGGNVTATGGGISTYYGGAGIGGGYYAQASNISISGGTILAIGSSEVGGAAGIGGGREKGVTGIYITGGNITAVAGDDYCACIGKGRAGSDASNLFVSTSLTIRADGNKPPQTIINNGGGDLANTFAQKKYCTITPE